MKNDIQVFENLKVKEENGQVLFDAETAAIGIGISTVAKSGNVVVRWSRVNQYLKNSTEVSKIKRGDYITEQQLYKLAIKAESVQAEKFQDWVTSEVLPTIRKTGSYQTPMSDFEKIALIAKGTKSLNDKVVKIESTVKTYIEERPLSATDYGAVGKAVNSKVHSYASIRKIPKSVRGPLFKDLNSQIKQLTGAGNRSRIMSRDYDRVIEFIDMWEPSTVTKSEVQELIEEM